MLNSVFLGEELFSYAIDNKKKLTDKSQTQLSVFFMFYTKLGNITTQSVIVIQ
jgi:hypothetical protein